MASNGSPSMSTPVEGEKAILSAVEKSYLNDAYSDMKIICGDKVFPAHRMILCPNSEYFRAACSGNFKDGAQNVLTSTAAWIAWVVHQMDEDEPQPMKEPEPHAGCFFRPIQERSGDISFGRPPYSSH